MLKILAPTTIIFHVTQAENHYQNFGTVIRKLAAKKKKKKKVYKWSAS